VSAPIEFRIPISPKSSFYRRVHFFCAALQRLPRAYAEARVRIVVGDDVGLDQVQAENRWSSQYNVEWHRVPPDVFAEHHYFATADLRYLLPAPSGGLVVLMDADSVVVRPFLQDLEWMLCDDPCISAHMAHLPPPVKIKSASSEANDLWPFLFQRFGIPWPETLYRYSMDFENKWPPVPAYYNLGFVVLNEAALRIFRQEIFDVQSRLRKLVESNMRCQIAVTLISYAHQMRRQNLPAIFNAANDLRHFAHNSVRAEEIRIIHYLRKDEINRDSFLNDCERPAFLRATLRNPVNQLLQSVVRQLQNL
jgi:hypothetical protein